MKQLSNIGKKIQQAIYRSTIGLPAVNRFSTKAASTLSHHKRFAAVLTVTAIAVIGIAVLKPQGTGAQSGNTDPDYTNVRSAITGTHLLRQDDIVLNFGIASESESEESYLLRSLSAATTQNSIATQNFDGFNIPTACTSCSYEIPYYPQDTTVVTGRFFDKTQDSVISYPVYRNHQHQFEILSGERNSNGNASFEWNKAQLLPYGTNLNTISRGVAEDFNGDGYDELLMTYSDSTMRNAGNGRLRIAKAIDVNDPSQGFDFGVETHGEAPDSHLAVTTGDFNGDNIPDIAIAAVGTDTNLSVYTLSVDPDTLAITIRNHTTVGHLQTSDQTEMVQLASGKFTNGGNEQLVLSHKNSDGKVMIRVFDFAPNSYAAEEKVTYTTQAGATHMKMITSQFDWGNPYDVITLMQSTANGTESTSDIYQFTVDPATYILTGYDRFDVYKNYIQYYMSIYPEGPPFGSIVALDIVAGNFNNKTTPDPQHPEQTLNDPDLQLAVLIGADTGRTENGKKLFGGSVLSIIGVGQNEENGGLLLSPIDTKLVKQTSTTQLNNNEFFNATINPVDLQGRSIRVGSGYKIAMDKNSTTLTLAQPPLHVDWAPMTLSGDPTVINLSFAIENFNSTFTTTDSTNNSRNYSKTSGWGFSGKESAGVTFTLGKVDASGNLENGAKISETFTAQQALNHSKEITNGSSTTTKKTIAQTTGVNDVVWFEEGTSYLYIYDVVGQKTCPTSIPNCSDAQKIPVNVMVTEPGPTSTQYISAEALEWYQPVWENGNVLSYPGNNDQLLRFMPNASVFGSATQRTDNAASSFTTTWEGTQSQGQNVVFSQMYQEDSDTNIEGVTGLQILGTGPRLSIDGDIDVGGSDSLSTMRTLSSTIESAKGMTVNKDVNFRDSNTYGYNFSGVIFGNNKPLSYFDGTDPGTPGTGLPPVNTDITIFGPMRSAFTVNPLANNQGGWWTHSYLAAPDVALNHPNRWNQTKLSSTLPIPNNCLDTNDGYMDCVLQKPRTPVDPWDNAFHSMRGFFIFKAGNADPSDPNSQGMQQQYATAGDQLSLQARVYNYSLKSMPAGTEVKVRFFGMPWNTTTMLPADYVSPTEPGGASFLIGETTLEPIKAWNNDTSIPNYNTASVNFDTTGRENQDIVFWVVVWMQDANGNLVQELPGKGVTARPDYQAGNFFQMTTLEPTVPNNWKTANSDPDLTSFSNNIGFYKQPFHIAVPSSNVNRMKAVDHIREQQTNLAAVTIRNTDVREDSITAGQSVEVYTTLRNEAKDNNISELSVYFYDGDPARGGKLFDVERLATIRPGSDHKVRTRFTPDRCGLHDLYVKVTKSGLAGAVAQGETQLRVRCTVPPLGNPRPPKITVNLSADTSLRSESGFVPVTAHITTFDKSDPRPDVRLESITRRSISDVKDDVAEADFGTDDRAFLLRAGKGSESYVYEAIYSATNWMGHRTYVRAYITLEPGENPGTKKPPLDPRVARPAMKEPERPIDVGKIR